MTFVGHNHNFMMIQYCLVLDLDETSIFIPGFNDNWPNT